jgi:hypothetical protein
MKWARSVLGLPKEVGFIEGRAPVHWGEELRRWTSRLDDLWIACDWIGLWRTAGEMQLFRDSLLGKTLEELTSSGHQKTEALKQALSEPKGRSNIRSDFLPPFFGAQATDVSQPEVESGKWLNRNLQSRSTSTKVDARPEEVHQMVPSPLLMHKRASQALLSRFVAEADIANGLVRIQPESIKIPGRNTEASPGVPWDAEIHRTWLHDIACRALNSLQQKELEALLTPNTSSVTRSPTSENRPLAEQWAVPFNGQRSPMDLISYLARPSDENRAKFDPGRQSSSPHKVASSNDAKRSSSLEAWAGRADGPGSTHQFAPEGSGDGTLAEQWTVPLIGQTAPMDLLSYLAGPSVENQAGLSTGQKNNSLLEATGSRGTKPALSSESQVCGSVETGSRPRFVPLLSADEALRLPGQRLGAAPQPIEHAAGVPFRAADQSIDIDSDMQMPSRIAPPKAALSLPDLLSPQMTKMPSTSAKQEAEAVTDDGLSILAARIKRILDEEARRHGIDV